MRKSKQQREKMQNSRMIKASRCSHGQSVLCLWAQLIGCHSTITLTRRRTANVLPSDARGPKRDDHLDSMTPFTRSHCLTITRFQENFPQAFS
jgi:hypothetical protein